MVDGKAAVRIRHSLNGLLTFDVPTRQWVAWCPELDVVTQGDHPDNATAMLEEACRMVLEDAINNTQTLSADRPADDLFKGEIVMKRVVHPLRLGAKASEDESWKTFQDMLSMKYHVDHLTRQMDIFELTELADGLDPTILVGGSFDIETRSGVVRVGVYFDMFGYVPCEKFTVEYMQKFERNTTMSLRSSVLKAAGADGQSLVTAEAAVRARDAVGEVRVRRP